MTTTDGNVSKIPSDTTFRSYTPTQAEEYAKRRGGYPKALIDEVIKAHTSTGGALGTLLDLGCGPGSATRDLAPHFDHAYGIDPSIEMIRTAESLGGRAKESPIAFMNGDAEDCPGISDNSIDLITAAKAGHWFDMERFWPTAARILKSGGAVIFFTIWRAYVHPHLTPHAEEVQKILMELEEVTLAPYCKPGNWSLMRLYDDVVMPWELSSPCHAFTEASYTRHVWNENGMWEQNGRYVCEERVVTLDEAEKAMGTVSPVTRWREAHPELVNTDEDCVRAAFIRIKEILNAGPEDKITMVGPSVLVAAKKDV